MKEMVSQVGSAMHAAPHDPPAVAAPTQKLLPPEPPGPVLPPKSEHLQRHTAQQRNHYPHDEQMRYEIQQQPASTAQASTTQPACLLWARDLQTLLNDDEGCELFEQYLQQENCDESDLMFVYACNGLRVQEDQQDRDKQARAIYKRYVKTGVVQISDPVKDVLAAKIRNRDQPLEPDIFDVARKEVEDYIMRTTFARFIQSDQYIDYVQRFSNEQDPSAGSSRPTARDDGDADEDYPELDDLDYEQDHSGLVSIPSDSEDDHEGVQFVSNTSRSSTILTLQNTNNINNNNNKHTNNNVPKDKSDTLLLNQQQQGLMPTLLEHEEDLENATFLAPPPSTLARKPASLQSQHMGPPRGFSGVSMAPSDHGPPPPLPPQSKIVQRQKRQAQLGMSYGESVLRQGGQRPPPNPYHVKSSAFVPPTAYNSDIQSMSSGGNGNYDLEASDCDTVIAARRSEQLPRTAHHHDIERRRATRAWPPAGELIRDPMRDKVIPRTMFPNIQESHLAERKPHEFFQKLCQKLIPIEREQQLREQGRVAGALEDEQHSQAILDDHVERVFKTPPVRTPRSPSPGMGTSRGGVRSSGGPGKSTQASRTGTRRFPSGNLKEIADSVMHGIMVTSGAASGAVPRIQPRGKGASATLPKGPLTDSPCDEGNTFGYSAQDNVREWINKTGVEATGTSSKSKASKASICSGSNRSSCRSNHDSTSTSERKKKGTLSSSNGPSLVGNEIAIIYTYAGESVPYYIRLAQRQVRLREFKSQLIKKGNFRYFFKRPMDEFNAQGVFEEIKDDNQILPFWEGKIVAQIGLMQPPHMPQEPE